MTASSSEHWTHTAIVIALPPGEVARPVVGAIQDDIAVVQASPEFDEVSVHLVVARPGNPALTSPPLDAVLLEALLGTEASTIAVVWCGYDGVMDDALDRALVALRAVRTDSSPLVHALRLGSPTSTLTVALRETVIGALDASDGAEGAPRSTLETAISGFPAAPEADVVSPVLLSDAAPALEAYKTGFSWPFDSIPAVPPLSLPHAQDRVPTTGSRAAPADHFDRRGAAAEPDDFGTHSAEGAYPENAGIESWTVEPAQDGFVVDDADHADRPEETRLGTQGDSLQAEPVVRGPGWLPPAVQDVVSSVSSQVEEWRARRTKVRRAEDQIGISAIEQLPVVRGVQRPLVYFALAASNDWDRRAVRTRDAALTILAHALDQRWIAVAVNLGDSLTREAGPASPERVSHNWKRTDRSNDFDLGRAASELEAQITRDVASLRLRGHELEVPHVVIFCTEPPYVDSAAHSAYCSLTLVVKSVTWMLVGDSDWMDVPAELGEAPSRVLHVERDGMAVLLREVLAPPAAASNGAGPE